MSYAASIGAIEACGATPAEAKASLASRIESAASGSTAGPAFAWDSAGALIVAVPNPRGGCHTWRITDVRGARLIVTGGDGSPEDQLAGCLGYTPVPMA